MQKNGAGDALRLYGHRDMAMKNSAFLTLASIALVSGCGAKQEAPQSADNLSAVAPEPLQNRPLMMASLSIRSRRTLTLRAIKSKSSSR